MIRPFLLTILLFAVFNSQAQRLIYDENIPVKKIRVVLEQAKGGLVSQMLSDLEYIPLQGGKNDLVDYIADIALLDDKIGIIAGNEGYFYLYNADGTFIKKITKIDGFKSANKDVKNLFFTIKGEDNFFSLVNGNFTARVDLNGNIVDTLTKEYSESKDDGFGQSIIKELNIENSVFKLYGSYQDDKRIRQDVLLFNDKVIIQYNPLDTIRTHLFNDDLSKVYNGKSYLTVGYNTKIFELSSSGIDKIYELVLPLRNTFDLQKASALKQNEYMNGYKYFSENNMVVYTLMQVMPYGDLLIFKAQRIQKAMWLLYNLKTNDVHALDNIIPDKSNDYLSFFNNYKLFVHGDYLYSFIYPQHIREAKNKSLEEGHTMRKEYAAMEKHNNPILVRFKLK